jgi:hypothetical protein
MQACQETVLTKDPSVVSQHVEKDLPIVIMTETRRSTVRKTKRAETKRLRTERGRRVIVERPRRGRGVIHLLHATHVVHSTQTPARSFHTCQEP